MRLKYFLPTILILFFASLLTAQTHTWSGNGGDNDWFNAANWDLNSVPASTDDAIIPDGFSVAIASSPVTITNLIVLGNSDLTIGNNVTFFEQIRITEDALLRWEKGVVTGGEVLDNAGTIEITTAEPKELISTTLENSNTILVENILFLRLKQSPVINNTSGAIFEIRGNAGLVHDEGNPIFNNEGLIKKTFDGSNHSFSYMIFELNNAGIVDIEADETFLFLSPLSTLNNTETGIISGFGIYDITANFTNSGTVYPGDNDVVGTLNVTNNFHFPADALLQLDIEGPNPGEFDVLAIVGFPILEGELAVNLKYAPEIGDEYSVITANDITACNLPNFINASFEGITYQFAVFCNPTNVTLRAVTVLGVDAVATELIDFYAQPNPVDATSRFILPSEIVTSANPSIVVYNYMGQVVQRIENVSENTLFNRAQLSSGLYFAQLVANRKVLASTKIILK